MKETFQITIQVDRDKLTKNEVMDLLHDKYKEATQIKCLRDYRTLQQNSALHKFFSQVSQEFNDKHITVKDFLGGSIELQFTPEIVKEIWRRIQKGAFNKKSTTELSRNGEIEFIWDTLNLYVSERWGGNVVLPNFPSMDEMFIKTSLDN